MTATMPAHRAQVPRFTPSPALIPADPESRDHRWPDRWPRRSYLELAALDTAPGCARKHACALLWEWGLDAITDESALTVSELVTNAMLSTQAQGLADPVRMWVLGSESSALFLIWDATMPAPVPARPAPEAEHGRGLTLVDALSTRWGCYYPAGPTGGKVVWSLLRALLHPMQHSAKQRTSCGPAIAMKCRLESEPSGMFHGKTSQAAGSGPRCRRMLRGRTG